MPSSDAFKGGQAALREEWIDHSDDTRAATYVCRILLPQPRPAENHHAMGRMEGSEDAR